MENFLGDPLDEKIEITICAKFALWHKLVLIMRMVTQKRTLMCLSFTDNLVNAKSRNNVNRLWRSRLYMWEWMISE